MENRGAQTMIRYANNKGVSALKMYLLLLGSVWLMLIAARLALAG